jgi:hypothetical protein
MKITSVSPLGMILLSFLLMLDGAISYGRSITINMGNQSIAFNGIWKKGSIVAEANGMDAINPGFDFEKGVSTSGWTSNDVQMQTDMQNRPTLSGYLVKVGSDDMATSLSQESVVVKNGDKVLVRDRAGNYVLMTIINATPQEVDFEFLSATSVQTKPSSSQFLSTSNSPHSSPSTPSNSSAIDGREMDGSDPNGTTPASGTGLIFYARYTPTGIHTKYVNSSGATVKESTSQLIEIYALNPANGDIKDTGLAADSFPRFSLDGRYAALYSPGSFTVLSLDNHKRIFKVNNAVVYGDAAASWSPNERYLAFQGGGSGGGYDWESGSLYVLDRTTGSVHTILDRSTAGVTVQEVHWLPDGELIFSTKEAFYKTTDRLTKFVKIPVTLTAPLEYGGRFDSSPNGKWLAFICKDTNGHDQVCVASMDGGVVRMVTHHVKSSVRSPRFSPNSEKIAYVSSTGLDGELRIVKIDGDDDHAITDKEGKPVSLVNDLIQWIPLRLKTANGARK